MITIANGAELFSAISKHQHRVTQETLAKIYGEKTLEVFANAQINQVILENKRLETQAFDAYLLHLRIIRLTSRVKSFSHILNSAK